MGFEEEKIVTFKLFVFKNQKPTEIRKFNLMSTDISFEKVEEILLAIFPNLKELKYRLLWKDQEDFITFSTAEEFSTFQNHVTNSEANEETKFFINFEDELFAVSHMFEQCRMANNSFCNTCQNNLTLMCRNCNMNKSQHGGQILNITNKKTPVQSTSSDENCEEKTSIACSRSNGTNSITNPLVKKSAKAFDFTPISTSNTFPAFFTFSHEIPSPLEFGSVDFRKDFNRKTTGKKG